MYCASDVRETEAYTFVAEFEDPKDAYTFAAELHGRHEYKDLHLILEDVVRKRETASRETVRLVFTPEGFVFDADEKFWSRQKQE